MARTTVSNDFLSGLVLLMATLAFVASRIKGGYGFWRNGPVVVRRHDLAPVG